MPLIDMLLPQFDRELETTRRLIEIVPGAELAWGPGGGARTFAELTGHLAEIPAWTCGVMNEEGCDVADVPVAGAVGSVTEALGRFDAGAAAARRTLVGRPDDQLVADWTLRHDGRVVFSLPRIVMVQALVLNHLVHHRGQLSVYLRMRGCRIPPIYGPAADDREPAGEPVVKPRVASRAARRPPDKA